MLWVVSFSSLRPFDAPRRYRNGPRWTSRFRHVCGIAHTNYEAYAIADNFDKDGAPEEYFNVRASVKLQFVLQSGVSRGLYSVACISRRSCPSLGLSEGRGAEIARRDRSHAARSEERLHEDGVE